MRQGCDWSTIPRSWHRNAKATVLRAPEQPLIVISGATAGRTGPGRGEFALTEPGRDLTRNARRNGGRLGERIIVTGHAFDGAGTAIPDVLVKIRQADAAGGYPGTGGGNMAFIGLGRQGTGADPVLAAAPAARRHALTATRDPLAVGVLYRFGIRTQGRDETVFFHI